MSQFAAVTLSHLSFFPMGPTINIKATSVEHPPFMLGRKDLWETYWDGLMLSLEAGHGGMTFCEAINVQTAGSDLVLKPVFSALLLCMSLCPPLHPNYRDFLMDILLSLLSDPVLLLRDEALFVCSVCVCSITILYVRMCNVIGLDFYTSLLRAVHCRLDRMTCRPGYSNWYLTLCSGPSVSHLMWTVARPKRADIHHFSGNHQIIIHPSIIFIFQMTYPVI